MAKYTCEYCGLIWSLWSMDVFEAPDGKVYKGCGDCIEDIESTYKEDE